MSEVDPFMLAFEVAYFKKDTENMSMRDQVRGRPRGELQIMSFTTDCSNGGMSICFTIDCMGNIMMTGGYSMFSISDLREMHIVAEEWTKDN